MRRRVKPSLAALADKQKRGSLRSIAPIGLFLVLLVILFQAHSTALSSQESSADYSESSESAAVNIYPLELRQPVERQLSRNNVHSYKLMLEAEHYVRLELDKNDLDLSLTLLGPDRQKLAEGVSHHYGPTILSFLTKSDGPYLLEVRSLEKEENTASYKLTVEEIRKAAPLDQNHVAALRAYEEGERMRAEWNADSSERAIQKYETALALWRSAGDHQEEARVLKTLGEVSLSLSHYSRALDYLKQALDLRRYLVDRRTEIEILNDVGSVYIYLGQGEKTLTYAEQAWRTSQRLGDQRGEAQALNNMGEAYYFSSDLQKAVEFFNRALSIWQTRNDRRGAAQTLNNLGYAYFDLREMQRAMSYYNQALRLWQAVGDRRGEGLSLTAMGSAQSLMGERQKAFDLHTQAVALLRLVGDRSGEAAALTSLGYLYEEIGEHQKALDMYGSALELLRAIGNVQYESVTTILLGRVYQSLGDYSRALDSYNHVLSLSQPTTYRLTRAYALNNIGMIYIAFKDKQRALDYYRRSERLYAIVGDKMGQAASLNNIGYVYDSMGQKVTALDYFSRARFLNEAVQDYEGEALTLFNLARVKQSLGDLTEARALIEAAIKIIESQRTKIAGQDLRASYLATVHQYYELYIEVLMAMHRQQPAQGLDALALQFSERGRARSLLEMLSTTNMKISQGVDSGLLDREQELKQMLDAKFKYQVQVLSGKPSKSQVEQLASEIRSLTTEYEQIEAQIREKSPRYAALTQPQVLGLQEIQRQVLDQNTLLLEYCLGDEKSYLWAISRTGFASYELPPRAEIEEAAREVYKLLIAHQPLRDESFEERVKRIKEADEQYWERSARLSQLLLGPVAEQLGEKRLIIVSDGALQYIPFEALTAPSTPGANQKSAEVNLQPEPLPLIVNHEISYLPSASVLAVLRAETAHRQPAPKSVAVLADPVFEKDDERLLAGYKEPPVTMPVDKREVEISRALRDTAMTGDEESIPRLQATRQEAEAIMSGLSDLSGLKATGFDANKTLVTGPELSQYRIIHFATHGFLNSEQPALSGLVLSLYDRQGQPQNGFLRLHDIYNLNLQAEMIVLSACNTGLGKDVKGEGLVGLTRGFMYAGAARVVASLWKVDDEATAELMRNFYISILQEGKSPTTALRNAQLAMWQRKRWRSPYYWSAFVLQGEYRGLAPVVQPRRNSGRWYSALPAITILLLLPALLRQRRRGPARQTHAGQVERSNINL